jgi:[ribosomal protein S5]-alanine N-acetyltransferase
VVRLVPGFRGDLLDVSLSAGLVRVARDAILPSMLPTFETERLILRPLQLADAEHTQPLFALWEIVEFLNNKIPWPFPPDGAYTYYRDVALPAMECGEEWHWTLRLKADPGKPVGAIRLVRDAEVHRGFWLGLPWQGRGLMTEAVIAVTDFWFHTLGRPVLRTAKAAANTASRRISEKLGMSVIATKESEYVSGTHLTEVWEITAENWREWRRSSLAA